MFSVMRIDDPNGNLRDVITKAVEILRQPAGPNYSCLEDIDRDRDQFVKGFHSGLFLLHLATTQMIIDTEGRIRSLGTLVRREAAASKKGWTRIRQLLRSINDAIVWTALHPEPGLFIRRTCRQQPRGDLRDQNPDSMIEAMHHLFAEGTALPIWNDATSCVDIGDITLFSPHGVSFVEVKTGKVNDQIREIMGKKDFDDLRAELDKFLSEYGKKGMKQIDRVLKQEDRASKLMELASHDNVVDPFLNARRVAFTPKAPLKNYDKKLGSLLKELRTKDFVADSIDGCLHVIALNMQRDVTIERGKELIKQYLQDTMSIPKDEEVDCRDLILSIESSFDYPTAMPLMLRQWSSEDIARVCLGHTEIYFGFDVNAWGRHLQSSRLVWSTKREGRKELSKASSQRLLIVGDRIAELHGPQGPNFTWYLFSPGHAL